MCRKTVSAMGRSDSGGVLLERGRDALLVLRRYRQEELLEQVGDLGQPGVQLAALLDLGLEVAQPLLEVVEHAARDHAHHPLPEGGSHVRHCATNRATGRAPDGPASSW